MSYDFLELVSVDKFLFTNVPALPTLATLNLVMAAALAMQHISIT
jgi:hypothetical protein